MGFSLAEIKELLAYGQELGLQQLQTEGLVAVYGSRAVLPAAASAIGDTVSVTDAETASILEMYRTKGRLKP